MEESVFHREKLWKEVLCPSGILTKVKSPMSDYPLNVAYSLDIKTLFGKENPKFYAENAPTIMS